MNRVIIRLAVFWVFVSSFIGTVSGQTSRLNPLTNPTLAELRANFKQPHRDYSTGPLWTWNDRLTEDQVRGTLRDLAAQHVRQVWVHPRPGLMTPYLSGEWFTLWKIALDEAEKLDMNVWIYDENSYPSGFAGGFVPEALPDSRGMGLRFEEVATLDKIDESLWYVYKPAENGYANITTEAKAAGKLETLPDGKNYLIGRVHHTPQGGWFGGWWYVDLLKKGVTEKFIETTFDAYKNVPEIQAEFGKRVPGIFTDEPHPAGSYVGTWVTWNEEIPVLFEKRFGYSLVDNLPSLHQPVGDWKKVRHNYHALILELFVDRWAKPCFEWCEANGLEFTGHYWEHGWPGTSHGPDNMAMYIWHQRPAIDLLMNGYNDTSPNAQFGNVRSVKELASVANQMGRSRTLSENYGAGGWDLRFEDMKRLGDWSYALGVNTNNEHLSYVTIRGARKRDHPQSFSYHAPWFEGYHVLADYFTRLSYVLSQGRQVNRVVVIEPTTTAWMYQGDAKLGQIGQSFTDFVNALERAQVEYDLASEDTIARLGKVVDKTFAINHGEYDLVILPPLMENLNRRTAELLAQYAKNGGKLLCGGDWPTRCDGAEPGGVEAQWLRLFVDLDNAEQMDVEQVLSTSKSLGNHYISLDPPVGGRLYEKSLDGLFIHRRKVGKNEILFLCNSSLDKPIKGVFSITVNTNDSPIEEWNLFSGEMSRCAEPDHAHVRVGGNIIDYFYRYEIPPAGSRLFVVPDTINYAEQPTISQTNLKTVAISGSETTVRRLEPNVLTLDFVDVKVGDEERKDQYTWRANRWVYEKHGMPGNPWDNQVQFRDNLITKEFPEGSGFEAVYRFTIKDAVPDDLAVVVERADLYTIYCNDQPVAATPDAWWLDRSFGRIDISKVAKAGENTVRIVASPMTITHELEPAYLLGDFSLENAEKGFVVVPAKTLKLKPDETAPTDSRHSDELEQVSWLSTGVGFRPGRAGFVDDPAPSLAFDLGGEKEIAAIRIWNYCERGLAKRSVKDVEITGLGKKTLSVGDGLSTLLTFDTPQQLKTVEFKILSNHAGTTYPIPAGGKPEDNGFAGLAEVQFLVRDAENPETLVPLKGVTVKPSSELLVDTHDRKAAYLLDGSGLGKDASSWGWNRQGMPFYSGKVEYSRTFQLDALGKDAKYSVELPESPKGWYGATARVVVNGKPAGFLACAPWSLDVSALLQGGENKIDVIVYGTPKNLLGPHHAGRLRGSAWPGSFQHGPDAQPGGTAYDVIDYGLFEPFQLNIAQ